MMSLAELNAASREHFVASLAGIYEHSPWVAEAVVDKRPFADLDALTAAMAAAVAQADPAQQLELIRAHPQLAGKLAIAGELTEASRREQQGAGLDRCSPQEFAELSRLNAAYQDRFGFPYILAVAGHTRSSILANLAQRVESTPATEYAEALRQIDRIAGLRLAALLA